MGELKIAYFGTNGHQIGHGIAKIQRARLVGVADVSADAFKKLKEEMPEAYAGAKRYGSLGALLRESGADMVSICSARRDKQHRHIVQALEAGLHVYAEKPLATTMKGLDAIRAAAEKSGKQVRSMTGMMYLPVFRSMRELVAAGKLGTLVQVFAQKSYPYHDGRPQDRGLDGGLIEQASVHAVAFVRYVTGLEFEEIYAMDTGVGNPKPGDLQTAGQYVARMTGGALCTVVCNYCNPPGIGFWGNDQLRVHGTGGMAESVNGATRTLVALGKDKPFNLPPAKGAGYDELLQDYIDHLLDGKPMLLSQEDSFRNTRVVVRAQESATKRRPLKV